MREETQVQGTRRIVGLDFLRGALLLSVIAGHIILGSFFAKDEDWITLDNAISAFREYIYSVTNLAEKIATLQKLSYEISSTKRRVNALNYIIIPRLSNTARFIDLSLEEEERENFSRMKVIKSKLNLKKETKMKGEKNE